MPTLAPPARMRIGFMQPRLDMAYPDLFRGSPVNQFSRPGTEAPLLRSEYTAEGWPNVADFNAGYHAGSGLGLPIDPMMTGLITFSFRGRCANGFGIAGNCTNLQYAYNATSDITSGTYLTTATGPNAANYTRLEFRGSTFKDTDGTQKPGLRDFRFLRPRHPGSTTESYTGNEFLTDEFLAYCQKYDFIRFFISGTGISEWFERTKPTFWNQNVGVNSDSANFPSYLQTLPPGVGPLGSSIEYQIAIANAADRDLLVCFPPNASPDYCRKWIKAVLYGTDGNLPYDGPVSNPVWAPLAPHLSITLEGGLEPWNFGLPYIIDMFSYVDQAIRDSEENNADWACLKHAIDVAGWPTRPQPQMHPAFQDLLPRKRVQQMVHFSDYVREIDAGALHTRIRPLYSPQRGAMPIAFTWHERVYGKLDPASPFTGTARRVNEDFSGAGPQAYYTWLDQHGLTNAVADPSFASPSVGNGLNLRPTGGTWTFSGNAGIAKGTDSNIPPAFSGSQVGYVQGGGEIRTSVTVPTGLGAGKFWIDVKALGRIGDSTTGKFKVYLDRGTGNEVDITPQSYVDRDGSVTPRLYGQAFYVPPSTWPARLVSYTDSEWFGTPLLDVQPGSTHTVSIVGSGDAGSTVFVGAVRLAASALIAASERPVLPAESTQSIALFRQSIRSESDNANAYGIALTYYEEAPSLGADDNGNYGQQYERYEDPLTEDAQLDVFTIMAEEGADTVAQGNYEPVPQWSDPIGKQGYINPAQYPIIRAIEDYRTSNAAVNYSGIPLPGTLNYQNRAYENATPNNSYLIKISERIGWTTVVTNPGVYRLSMTQDSPDVANQGPTLTNLMVDGAVVGSGSSPVVADVPLGAGQHGIKLWQVTGGSGAAVIQVTRIGDLPDPGPATAYSLTVGNSRVVGTPIPVTCMLLYGDPLDADVAITLACQGATIAGPVVIHAGQASGQGSITPTAIGAFALTATNDGGLSNPGALSLTFTGGGGPGPQPGARRVILFVKS